MEIIKRTFLAVCLFLAATTITAQTIFVTAIQKSTIDSNTKEVVWVKCETPITIDISETNKKIFIYDGLQTKTFIIEDFIKKEFYKSIQTDWYKGFEIAGKDKLKMNCKIILQFIDEQTMSLGILYGDGNGIKYILTIK